MVPKFKNAKVKKFKKEKIRIYIHWLVAWLPIVHAKKIQK